MSHQLFKMEVHVNNCHLYISLLYFVRYSFYLKKKKDSDFLNMYITSGKTVNRTPLQSNRKKKKSDIAL